MAQAPQGFTYQGVATDNNGFELQNQTISIQASILSSSATGTTVWQETHTTTTDTFGLFNVTIGEGTSTNNGSSATFQEIDWGAASHFMKVEIDVNGGSNYVHVGTSQMMSVPYALYAENVHNLNMDSILGAVYDSINTSFSSGAMSVSAFGDTLTLNGQSIFIPGISYINNSTPTYGSVTDASGNTYQTIQIGTQEWMVENLRTTKFANGNDITFNCTLGTNSNNMFSSPSWAWYNCDQSNEADYGKLYNLYTVTDSRNACPAGWHVPSEIDWEQLFGVFGQLVPPGNWYWDAGGDLKSIDGLWSTPNVGATNHSFMNIVPGGSLQYSNSSYGIGNHGVYWTSYTQGGGTSFAGTSADFTAGSENVGWGSQQHYYQNSIRCVKD